MKETGLIFYNIPASKKNRSSSKLAELAAKNQIDTWKNNSKIIANDKYKVEKTSIVDLRLHMLIENIFLQIIIICDGDRIYQIMCFRDTDDKAHFDTLINKVREKHCFQ